MKNNVFVLIILIFLIVLCTAGCNNSVDKNIVETAKKVEILDNKFASCLIKYDDYFNSIKPLFSSIINEEKHIERNFIIPVENLNKAEYEKAYNFTAENNFKQYDAQVHISGVYEFKSLKNVYIKKVVTPRDNESIIPYTVVKKYNFAKEDDEWKIISIERNFHYEKPLRNEKNIFSEEPDGKPIEYKQTIDPFEN
ncbi:hypothetical protein [Abyssisolibacter fermentans]|uniref:hypothetical protein n=1 Tax=Abyssisolibacter fermentans TaxID=1766203 RepID=UPI0008312D57|nr:hypothetical protein [Abyssisolibacter fermentans]